MADKKVCLVIDDSMVARMIVKDFTQTLQPDWELLEAKNGQEGLDILQSQQVDFVSVDYNMPVMSGMEMLSHRQQAFPNAKCVLLTANVQEQTHIDAGQLDVKCLNKPITQEVVQEMVNYFNG